LAATAAAANKARPNPYAPPRPFDDPANPYKDRYTPLDRWVYEHRSDSSTENFLLGPAEDGTDPHLVAFEGTFGLDAEGWMLPLDLSFERWPAALETHMAQRRAMTVRELFQAEFLDYKRKGSSVGDPCSASAARTLGFTGWAPASLRDDYEQMRIRARAQALPPIPAWLGENPPLGALFLPDGDVMCHGALGERYEPLAANNQASYETPSDPWYRYDSAGKLLSTTPAAPIQDLLLGPETFDEQFDVAWDHPWRSKLPQEPAHSYFGALATGSCRRTALTATGGPISGKPCTAALAGD
jgi:hypothetical protein